MQLDNNLDSSQLSPDERDLAAAYLLPRAEAALRQELQRLADTAKRARENQTQFGRGDGP
jgi:hypothetical protein